MEATSPVTTLTVSIYIGIVFVLAVFSHRLLQQKSFIGEYFLGSRGLGSWAFAFTFAATATSGGSFTGFPSLIYSFGWVLALWIGSYMIYSLCAMGVIGKRLNQVARKTGAITIPDVLRDRFESTGLGLFATCTIIFFTTVNLVAQFRAGGLIVEEIFNIPPEWGYPVALLIFASIVILYTAYGGFRAVVWTDVLQGVVMVIGVVLLLPIVLSLTGGLGQANRLLIDQPPTLVTSIPGPNNDLAFILNKTNNPGEYPVGIEYAAHIAPNFAPTAQIFHDTIRNEFSIRVFLEVDSSHSVVTAASEVKKLFETNATLRKWVNEVHHAFDNDGSGLVAAMPLRRFLGGEEYLFGPGRKPDGTPFHPLGMAVSYFFMWAIAAMGQPAMMIRLMAFRDSRTLKRAILIVTLFFAAIYLPLVIIFSTARILLPYLPQESSDKAMVLVATRVVAGLGFPYEILGALIVAATLAAIMSTVDSFLLMISSGFVRDIYQKTINPEINKKAFSRASYAITVLVGVIVTFLATKRIDFLQYIVVFTSSGFAAAFLFPVLLALFWKGMTRVGALCSMTGGLTIVLGLFAPTLVGGGEIHLMGLHPLLWGLLGSLLFAVVGSTLSGPPPEHLVKRYFAKSEHLTSQEARESEHAPD